MFYSFELFGRKSGDLGKMWLVGTMGHKKLTRAAILKYNLVALCQSIKLPKVPLALPTQSTLLRGVVRIEEKQTGFLFTDALEARAKLAASAHSSVEVDLPAGQSGGAGAASTAAGASDETSVAPETLPSRSMNLGIDLTSAPGADLSMLGGLGGFDNLVPLSTVETTTVDTSKLYGFGADLHDVDRMPELGMDNLDLNLNDLSLDDLALAESLATTDYGSLGGDYGDLGLDRTRKHVVREPGLPSLEAPTDMDDSRALEVAESAAAPPGFDAESAVLELTATAQASGTAATRKRRRLEREVVDESTELSDDVMAFQLGNVSVCTGPRPTIKRVRILGMAAPGTSGTPAGMPLSDIGTSLSLPLPLSIGLLPDQLPLAMIEQSKATLGTAASNPNISTIGVHDRTTAAAAGLTHILQDFPGVLDASSGFFEDVIANNPEQDVGSLLDVSTYEDVELGRGAAPIEDTSDLGILAYFNGVPVDTSSEALPGVTRLPSQSTVEQVSSSQLPDLTDITNMSQFELPVEQVPQVESQTGHRLKPTGSFDAATTIPNFWESDGTTAPRVRSLAELGRVARVFYRIVESAIDAAVPRVSKIEGRAVNASEIQVSFTDALQHAAENSRTPGKAVRLTARDAALSFVNLLALRSDDVVETQQDAPYMPIYLSHGRNWHLKEE